MEYVQLYPEYDFIFLGDNGQGDAMCADRVIEKAGEREPFHSLAHLLQKACIPMQASRMGGTTGRGMLCVLTLCVFVSV